MFNKYFALPDSFRGKITARLCRLDKAVKLDELIMKAFCPQMKHLRSPRAFSFHVMPYDHAINPVCKTNTAKEIDNPCILINHQFIGSKMENQDIIKYKMCR